MSEKIIETKVALAGTRESIIRILNRAFRMCSNKEFRIADGDSLEAINRKIDAANKHMAGYQTGFTLMDYLDDRAVIEWKLSHSPRKSLGCRTPLEYCKKIFKFGF